MEKANEEKYEARARLEKIDDEIAEKNAEIKRLSEELDDIYDMSRQSDNEYEEILSYWAGTSAYRRMSESNDTRKTLLRKLITNREADLRNAKEERKRLLDEEEDIRFKHKAHEEA